jgi:hypothetical protein
MDDYADRIKPDSYGITTYLENLRRGQYQIPTFQREVVWDRDRVKRLWDSLYKFYPLGSILVWRTPTPLHSHREIGGHLLRGDPPGGEFQYLLDGQQRTTALLTSIYGGRVKDNDGDDLRVYVDLTIDEREDVEDESWRERFLFWTEVDDRGGQLLRNTGRQKRFDSHLIVTLEAIARRYQELEERLEDQGHGYRDPARENLRRFKRVFDNYKLSFIELRGIEVAAVCQIFERINVAGQPLSMFDIVVAKTFRPEAPGVPGFYLRALFQSFRRELEAAGSRYSDVDDMTLLQVLAVLVREAMPESGVQNITDRYLNVLRAEHVEPIWEDTKHALRKVFDFPENHLHLPGPALIPYRYFYMSLASYFLRNRDPDYEFLKRYFWYVSFHNEDILSNTTHLQDHIRRLKQARAGGKFGFDRFLVDRRRLTETTYSSRGRLSRAVLALYANQSPMDWKHKDRSILGVVYYTLTDHPNLHHIFPLDFCKNLGERGRQVDSLLNIAYLTQITNIQISNSNPVEYLREYMGSGFEEVEQAHLLPDVLGEWARGGEMPDNALDVFIEARLELLLKRLREYLGEVAFEIVDTRPQDSARGQGVSR